MSVGLRCWVACVSFYRGKGTCGYLSILHAPSVTCSVAGGVPTVSRNRVSVHLPGSGSVAKEVSPLPAVMVWEWVCGFVDVGFQKKGSATLECFAVQVFQCLWPLSSWTRQF